MFFYLILGYIALYIVIWLHEVGHGLAYAKYQCKENAFHVHVPPYLFFSTPQPIEMEKAKLLTNKQFFHIGMAGIIINLIFGLPISYLLITMGWEESFITFFITAFALFHLVEAASYLTISNLFLSSDIISVQNYKPIYRVPLFILGVIIIGLIVVLILNSPENWRIGFVFSIIIMILSMVLGRVIFSMRVKAKAEKAR